MSMFIHQTKTNNAATGESYVTHRLVRGEHIGGKVRQFTVLPLGRHFPINQEEWPLLCQRIEQITRDRSSLLQSPCPYQLERAAQRYGKEVRLYCHSAGRERKERGMTGCFARRFESALQKIADGLRKPRGEKDFDKLMERIGRLKQKSAGASQHYSINLVAGDATADVAKGTADKVNKKAATPKRSSKTRKAVALIWEKIPVEGTMVTHPGAYCLRSNEREWDAEKLWRTYTMLTDLESVFRSLKTELGLRPVYHSSETRVDGHLFITVLAYQCVQVLRAPLKEAGIQDRWAALRDTLAVQQRVTVSFAQRDGSTLNVRKSTLTEPDLMNIYREIGVTPAPGGTKKMIA